MTQYWLSLYHNPITSETFLTINRAKDLENCSVQCCKNYINQGRIQNGPLFCFVPCTHVTKINVSVILNNCLSFANIQISKISSHSFQIGMTSHCVDCGLGDGKINLLGRWKWDALKSYTRPVNLCNYRHNYQVLSKLWSPFYCALNWIYVYFSVCLVRLMVISL